MLAYVHVCHPTHVLQGKVASAQAKSDKLAAAVTSWGGSMLRKAFVTWKERHASWQQGHAKVARAASLWQNRALACAWQQWKEGAIYQQQIRLCLAGAVGVSLLAVGWQRMTPVSNHSLIIPCI